MTKLGRGVTREDKNQEGVKVAGVLGVLFWLNLLRTRIPAWRRSGNKLMVCLSLDSYNCPKSVE